MTTIPVQGVTTLAAAAQRFKAQLAAGGPVSLDATVLSATAADALAAAWGYAPGTGMTVAGVQAADIPDAPGASLRVAGTATPFGGTAVPVSATFLVDGNGALQATVDATMPAGWTFPQSFPALALYPFDADTTAATDAHFVYTTAPAASYAPWTDKPQETVALAAGLNFAGWLSLTLGNSAAAVLASILGVATSLKFAGPFTLGDTPYPVTRIAAALDGSAQLPLVGDFSVSGLGLALEMGAPADGEQESTLSLSASTSVLTVEARIDRVAPGVTFVLAPSAGQTLDAGAIATLPGGQGFTDYIPTAIKGLFDVVTLRELVVTMSAPATVGYIGLSIGTAPGTTWPLIPKVLELDALTLELQFLEPGGADPLLIATVAATASIPISAFSAAFDMRVELDQPLGGGTFEVGEVGGRYYGTVSLGDLIDAIPGAKGNLPATLHDFVFTEFAIDATKTGGGYRYSVRGGCEAAFPMLDTGVIAGLAITADYGGGAYDVNLTGTLLVGVEEFALALELARADGTAAASGSLLATWQSTGAPIELADLADAFGFSAADLPNIPPALDLNLTSAALLYEFSPRAFGIGLESSSYGNAVFAALPDPANANKWQYFFGIAAPHDIDLLQLPLVSSFAGGDAHASINGLQVLAASREFSASLGTTLTGLITRLGTPAAPGVPATTPYPAPPAGTDPVPAGVQFSLELQVADFKLPVALSLGGGTHASSSAATALVTDGPPPAADAQGAEKWFQVGKSLGPVSFQRIGVRYQSGTLFFLLDASLGLSTLALGLDGLGIGSPLNTFAPVPHLDGLSLAFSAGPVTVSGGMINVPAAALPPGVDLEFVGEVVVQVDPYSIGGVASYARVQGQPSVFVFAQLRGEVGGPPAFFVTGFMGGFGYNSQLALPAPDDVHSFPFLAGLDDPTVFGGAEPSPLDVLNVLMGGSGKAAVVTPTVGESWIAGGVTFRSFELVLGRALLVVSFGREFEVALLGLASVSLPQDAPPDEAYAYVELQIEVLFKPDEGVFSAIASLTPSSFLLTRSCHLTGGFAFCVWFAPSPYAGDFVVTAGGYHPAFVVPAWYPQVALVGFNWQVSGDVVVKGGAYFALTPTAGMAGGSLEVLFQTGDLRAWFSAWANMMIRWKPFYFTANIGISIGASYRLNLLFTSVTIAVELGATLDLWGPPTGGVAHVHWSIISFSVGFGADERSASAMTLDWTGFQGLLPNKPAQTASVAGALAAVGDTPATTVLLDVNVNAGLTRRDAEGRWVVRADALQLTTTSAFPLTSILLNAPPTANAQGSAAIGPPQRPVTLPATATATIDIRPMGRTGVTSTHTVALWNVTEARAEDLAAWPTAAAQSRNLPESLWGAPLSDADHPAPTATTLAGLPVGITLAPPRASAGASVGPVSPDELVDDLGTGRLPLDPGSRVDPIAVPRVDAATVGAIVSAAATDAAWGPLAQAQTDLLTALDGAGTPPPTRAALRRYASDAGQLFSQPPLRTGGTMVRP